MTLSARTFTATLAALAGALALVASAPTASAASGTVGGYGAGAMCTTGTVSVSPTMRTTSSVQGVPTKASGQYVAYRAWLYRWDGQKWGVAQTGQWLWGYAASGQETSVFHSYSAPYAAASTSFKVTSGYYGVVLEYYWYQNADVSSGYTTGLAQHQDMGGPSNGYCKV